jgi:hypothetical protein
VLRKFGIAVSIILLACACQAVLGDFTVEPAPAPEPALVLGTACEPEEYRCAGAVLERCADDRQGFVPVETCASAVACNLNAKACRPCMTGEFMCRGAVLERCDGEVWVPEADCFTAALCSVSFASDVWTGTCVGPTCTSGTHQCDGPLLTRCSPARDGWEKVELCENGELCDAMQADADVALGLPARCMAPACAPNAFRCEGGTLRVCAPDRMSFIDSGPCESTELCSATRGSCGACEPDEIECNGAELRRCTEAGIWETLEMCGSAALCDAEAEECQKAECPEPGALRCGNRPVLERCSADLIWEDFEACANEELCSASAGRCLAPACAVDETRCRGGQFERCSADRTRWVLVAACGVGESCDAMVGCTPESCMDENVHCNGSSLERCMEGQVEVVQRCATASLCDASMGCTVPECGPGPEFKCNGEIIQRCLPGRDDFADFFTCEEPTFCDAPTGAGDSECDVCTPDEYDCTPEGTAVLRCSPDGQAWETVQSCPGGCMLTGSASPSCD